ncbi:MAG: SDR family NAD(P)-dependent oxidoreductase, partial [Cyanobacteria bacterium J06555_13]
MSYDIKEKTILITGANRGIGKAFVDAFIEYGVAKVYAAVRRLESATPLVEKYGDKVVPVHVDLTEPSSITALAKEATDVQVVISNAGAFKGAGPLEENTISALEFEIGINVYGLIRMAQAFAPVLKANGGGAFIQLNSVA